MCTRTVWQRRGPKIVLLMVVTSKVTLSCSQSGCETKLASVRGTAAQESAARQVTGHLHVSADVDLMTHLKLPCEPGLSHVHGSIP